MEWSPIHPFAQGSSSAWVPQWVCRSYGSSASIQDIPDLPTVSCSRCSSSAAVVFQQAHWTRCSFLRLLLTRCPSRQCRPPTSTSHTGASSSTQQILLIGSCTVLFPIFHPSPGSGTQSWLFCPLISLGLALAESRLGVPPYSTGNCEQVPSEQSQFFWATHALPIIHAHADHFHSLDRSLPATLSCSHGKRTLGLCRTRSCYPSQHHVHDCNLAFGRNHPLLPGGGSSPTSAPPPPPFPPPVDASPVSLLTLLLIPKPQARSLLLLLPLRFGPLLPLCRLQLLLLQGRLTFFLLWLQAPFLSTLLHHPLSPRLQILRFPTS